MLTAPPFQMLWKLKWHLHLCLCVSVEFPVNTSGLGFFLETSLHNPTKPHQSSKETDCVRWFFFPKVNASYEANRYLAVWLACQMCLFVRLLLCSSLPAIITQFPRKSNCTLLSALCILLLSTAATVDREETALLTPEGITVYTFRR